MDETPVFDEKFIFYMRPLWVRNVPFENIINHILPGIPSWNWLDYCCLYKIILCIWGHENVTEFYGSYLFRFVSLLTENLQKKSLAQPMHELADVVCWVCCYGIHNIPTLFWIMLFWLQFLLKKISPLTSIGQCHVAAGIIVWCKFLFWYLSVRCTLLDGGTASQRGSRHLTVHTHVAARYTDSSPLA